MQNVGGDPNQYSSSDLATVDHIRDEAKKLYSMYIVQKVTKINYHLITSSIVNISICIFN